MIVALRFVRDRRRSLLLWSIGVAAMIVLVTSMFPSLAGNDALDKLFEGMPAAVKMLAGAPEGLSFTSPAGYLHSKLFALTLPMLLMIFGIGIGARAIGGSEADGTLELLLSNPVTRTRVVVERFATMIVLIAALAVVGATTVVLANTAVGSGLETIPVGNIVGAAAAAGAIAIAHASLAFAAGCVTGNRTVAIAVAAVAAVAGYLVHGLAAQSEAMQAVGAVSPWHWYLDRVILLDGASTLSLVLPLVVSTMLGVVGAIVFVRRDLH